ncbi:hypothetical protein VNO77_19074 [Canavalia gladiata]|uniref:Uncharacterized protein n=1 Tax=Canavalia gladiata TaxID=3824 RepID=A0AAN9QK70_CANGL
MRKTIGNDIRICLQRPRDQTRGDEHEILRCDLRGDEHEIPRGDLCGDEQEILHDGDRLILRDEHEIQRADDRVILCGDQHDDDLRPLLDHR